MYRQCVTNMKCLEKPECINYATTITLILKIGRQNWSALGITKIIDYGVFICKCKVTSSDNTKTYYQFYDSHFAPKKGLLLYFCN